MKKIIFITAILFISILSAYPEGKRTLAVYPLSNPKGEKWINNLGKSVTDTVVLSLTLMGRYNIEKPEIIPAEFDPDKLSALAESNGFDNIIFGECLVTENGYKVGISIYDLSKDGITEKAEEEFYSLLESFNAADNLVDVLVGNLSGEKVYFGSLSVKPSRNEPYRTEINGIDIGTGFSGSDKVITGKHLFKFYQDRGRNEELIGSEEVEIMMRRSSEIRLEIPWLTKEEALGIRTVRNSLIKNYFEAEEKQTHSSLFSEAFSITDNKFISKYRPELKTHFQELEKIYKEELLKNGNFKNSLEVNNSRIIEKVFADDIGKRSGKLNGTDLSRKAVMFQDSFNSTYPLCDYDAEIIVDGRMDDWQDISSVFVPKGDFRSEIKTDNRGSDFVRIGLSTDRKNLYIMLETEDKKYRKDCRYSVYLSSTNLLRLSYYPEEGRSELIIVPEQNWNNSRKSNAVVSKSAADIIEMAVPLSQIKKNIETDNFVVKINCEIQTTGVKKDNIDYYEIKAVIPTFYYALSSEPGQSAN